jgi:hypothetical protein
MCYAVQLAQDAATDPVYADGWQAGDNGGTGFEPWNFDGSYDSPVQHGVDTAPFDTFNNIGTAWKLFNPVVEGAGGQRDIARAGRGFAPLQVGQTLRVVVDNPGESERLFFRGYFVRFNSRGGIPGGGNICYGGAECTPGTAPESKAVLQMFDYFTYGQWGIDDGDNDPNEPEDFFIPLFDTDTDDGMQIDMTITGTDTYQMTIDPLGTAATHTETGVLRSPGMPIDWLEFTFFNTQSDPSFPTDFYIKSIEIFDAAPPGVLGDYNANDSVDAADYVLWRNGGPLANEVADPGTVSAADYNEWKARFGNTAGSGAHAEFSAAAIPEPSTVVYLVAGFAGLVVLGARGFAGARLVPAACKASRADAS